MIKTTAFNYDPKQNRLEITSGNIIQFQPQNHGILGIDLEVLKYAASGVIETRLSGNKEEHIILPLDESKKDAVNAMLSFYLDPDNRHEKLFFEHNSTTGETHVGPTIHERIASLSPDCDITKRLAPAFKVAGDGTYRMVKGGGFIIKARDPGKRDAAHASVPADMKPKFDRA